MRGPGSFVTDTGGERPGVQWQGDSCLSTPLLPGRQTVSLRRNMMMGTPVQLTAKESQSPPPTFLNKMLVLPCPTFC